MPSALECGARRLTLEKACALQPGRPTLAAEIFDALQLHECGDARPSTSGKNESSPAKTNPARFAPIAAAATTALYFVDAAFGNDEDAGDAPTRAFRTVARAVAASRARRTLLDDARFSTTIALSAGVHFLRSTLEIDARDAETCFAGAPPDAATGEPTSWLSGGELLSALAWEESSAEFPNASARALVWRAVLPRKNLTVTGLFTLEAHTRLTRARYPNGDAELTQWGYNSVDRMLYSLPLLAAAEWVKSPRGEPPSTVGYVDMSKPCNPTGAVKDDSTMARYNSYGNGYGGVCDLWALTRELGSYWCSNVTAGGWAEVDALMASKGLRLLPASLKYNRSHPRVAKLADWGDAAVGAVVHAWHPQSWFVDMFRVTAHAAGELHFGPDPALPTGGWQGGRVWCTCGGAGACAYAGKDYCRPPAAATGSGDERLLSGDWYVENDKPELDMEGEFFFDEATDTLYLSPNATVAPDGHAPTVDLVAPQLATLVRVAGAAANGVTFDAVGFRDARKTFLDAEWAAPSGGDWSVFRGGAVEVRDGPERTTFTRCAFKRLDGNALFVGGHARETTVVDSSFEYVGDSAVVLWGETDEWDGRAGNQPRGTKLERCYAHDVGLYEKQSSPLFQAKACQTTVKDSIFYNLPRAAVNFNDGFGGGNQIENNLIFNVSPPFSPASPIRRSFDTLFPSESRL